MPWAAVTGLAAEAVIARRIGWQAVATGGDAARGIDACERLIAEGASALVSFGICGGLDPALAPGSLVLPLAVTDEAGARLAADPDRHRGVAAALAQAGLAVATGTLIGMADAVSTPARKRALHTAGAVAADLESHLVARAATAAGLPFLVLRAVADPAARALPPAALVGLDAQGRAALAPVLASLLRHPAQLPALLRIARETNAALRALRRAGEVLRGAPLAK